MSSRIWLAAASRRWSVRVALAVLALVIVVRVALPYVLRAQIVVGGATRFVTGTRITVQPHAPPAALSVLVVPGESEPSFTQSGAPARAGPPPRQAPPSQRPPLRRPPTVAP